MESLFNMTRLAQLGVDIPQNLDDEFERISNVDLVDAPNAVDANIRLKSLLRKLEPTLTRLNTRRDEAQTALDKLRQHVTALIASDADGKGPESAICLPGSLTRKLRKSTPVHLLEIQL